jgi:hypothetical protein
MGHMPKPQIPNSRPYTLHSKPYSLCPILYTLLLHPAPCTLDSLVLLVELLRGPDETILPKLIVEVRLAPPPFASLVVPLHADLI